MRTVISTILTVFILAFIPTVATAAPAPAGRFISQDDWAGYVDVSDIHMSGGTFYFTTTIEATRGVVPVNPFYFIAKADDGTTYDDPDYSYTTLHSGGLSAGEKVKGRMAFTVTGPRPTSIVYEGVLGETLTKWTVTWRPAPKAPNTPKPKRPAAPFGSSAS